MITYLYWALVIGLTIGAVFLIAVKLENTIAGFITAGIILAIGWGAYHFHFEQVFVKRWGGVMTISVPPGQHHITATWKEDNLWIENYDPVTNTCIFSEYSKGNLLQGKVKIKDCNPLMPR